MQVECILSLEEQAFVVYGERRSGEIIWISSDDDVKTSDDLEIKSSDDDLESMMTSQASSVSVSEKPPQESKDLIETITQQ